MSPGIERYVLIAKCTQCTFQVTQEVRIEPEKLVETKTELAKQAAAIHKQHPDVKNFVVF